MTCPPCGIIPACCGIMKLPCGCIMKPCGGIIMAGCPPCGIIPACCGIMKLPCGCIMKPPPCGCPKPGGEPHIAEVLTASGVPKGSAVYVMSNEDDSSHFSPLESAYGFRLRTLNSFPRLAGLMACDGVGACENYMLFAVENQILAGVPKDRRFVTLFRNGVEHNPHVLYKAFEKECQPH